jgi:DNA (cytosine-5)-methyltransferase 1
VLAFLRICGEDCTGLVEIDGVTYRIVDIGMRMLQPHELYRAQGFLSGTSSTRTTAA